MAPDILKVVGQVAGLGGVSVGVLLLIFRAIIQKNPGTYKKHAYPLLRLIIWLTWSVAVLGTCLWAYVTIALAENPDEPPAKTSYSVEGSVQKYHIIRGATEPPRLLEQLTLQPAAPSDEVENIIQQVIAAVNPKPTMEVEIELNGPSLSVSHPVKVLAAGGGIQFFGAYRKIAMIDQETPLDCDKLFAGKYPGGYFKPSTKITLWFEAQDGLFKNEQVIVTKTDHGYSLQSGSTDVRSNLVLTGRPAVVVVASFDYAGSDAGHAKQIAIKLQNAMRSAVNAHKLLRLSPHSLEDMYRVHDEVKHIDPDSLSKGPAVREYAVDYIVSLSIVAK